MSNTNSEKNVNILPNSEYIRRTFDLSRLGVQSVRSNPTVGSIIVKNNIILAEGYYKMYGGRHAEVNAFENLHASQLFDNDKLGVTLYVSLEPCCIVGKTPACTDLIKQNSVSKVVIGSIDKTPRVDGNGVTILENAGIKTLTNVEKLQGDQIAKTRNIFAIKQRPYITLKWAESADGFLTAFGRQSAISNEFSKRLVHKWRSEHDAILVGTNTALIDNPQLNNRHYFGPSPIRIVLDRTLKLPSSLKMFNDNITTWVVTEQTNNSVEKVQQGADKGSNNVVYIHIKFDDDLLRNLLDYLHEENIGRLFVEGGAETLTTFMKQNYYDEIRVIKSSHKLEEGLEAPTLNDQPDQTVKMANDRVSFYYK